MSESSAMSDYSESDFGSTTSEFGGMSEEKLTGYYGISTILVEQIYAEIFQPERLDETLKEQIFTQIIEQMVQITKILSPQDRENKILPIIQECIKDEEDEERRMNSIILIDELAETLGNNICTGYLVFDFVSLQDDPSFKIRREMVTRMIRFSQTLGEKIFIGVIIPVFRKLSQD
jgi:hypothetical protein